MDAEIEIEFVLKNTRLEFSGMGRPLVLNPRECQGSPLAPEKRWPYCGAAEHQCSEIHTSEINAVPLSRFLDEAGDYAASWFAFWEEDCMDPPIYIVRAESFEQAYEDFCATLPAVKIEDLDEDQIAAEKEGSLSGYSYADGVGLVYTECVNGREIELVSATVLS